MSNKIRKIICIFYSLSLLIFVLTGCNRGKIVDDIHMISIIGFDKEDRDYIGTALYTDYIEEQNQGKIYSLQGHEKSTKLILNEINNQSSKPIEIGKLQLLLFSENLARDGISHIVKTICKDPLIGSNLIIAVSKEPTEKILNNLTKEGNNYLPKLIEQNFKSGNVPVSNLQIFLFDYYGEGRDVSVPFINLNEHGKVGIDGYAVFKKDHLSLVLNHKEMALYKILQARSMNGDMSFKVSKGQQEGLAVLTSLYGEKIESVSKHESGPKVTYSITLHGMVRDYPVWLDLKKNENYKLLTRQLEKQMNNDLLKLLLEFQEHEVDPLGVGDLVRAHSKKWDEEEFYDTVYPNVTFDIKLSIQLHQSGIGD
ncbi:Ger(x)C family spore germination protein [Metabacillus sediminilitoris]|uniref:Ger(X)C family spore germination protein n=1 Tax=Metabacillus sediminilitoris TaxID=2567941 RepID=A0A4S4BX41_9BACI|nr:Ger(x)C family spore germination protein [Metabacillus sediminilitoris]QGQ46075.1 Ger(x)C family spore germination protein [Metabacillus sediminilitoris]THF79759.1 Ger(x)C family spore germination protein [Metabacillus sediminilitoris]